MNIDYGALFFKYLYDPILFSSPVHSMPIGLEHPLFWFAHSADCIAWYLENFAVSWLRQNPKLGTVYILYFMSNNQKLEPSVQSNIIFLYYSLGSFHRSDLSYLRNFNLQVWMI
jgi:hypothetical protein